MSVSAASASASTIDNSCVGADDGSTKCRGMGPDGRRAPSRRKFSPRLRAIRKTHARSPPASVSGSPARVTRRNTSCVRSRAASVWPTSRQRYRNTPFLWSAKRRSVFVTRAGSLVSKPRSGPFVARRSSFRLSFPNRPQQYAGGLALERDLCANQVVARLQRCDGELGGEQELVLDWRGRRCRLNGRERGTVHRLGELHEGAELGGWAAVEFEVDRDLRFI